MKKVSIVIPVYNEKDTVKELLEKIYNLHLDKFEKEIIIIEDNSNDGTREIVKDFCQRNPECKLVLNDAPKGKGHAVRVGFEHASGDIFAIQDADLEYDVNDYQKLLRPFIKNNAQFVLGSRHLNENGDKLHMVRKFHGKEKIQAFFMNLGGYFIHGFFNLLYGKNISDPTTMYKLFTRDLYNKVTLTGNYFELDFEIVSKFVRLGYDPIEIPITYNARGFSKGKKIKLSRDIGKWLYMIISCRFLPKSKL